MDAVQSPRPSVTRGLLFFISAQPPVAPSLHFPNHGVILRIGTLWGPVDDRGRQWGQPSEGSAVALLLSRNRTPPGVQSRIRGPRPWSLGRVRVRSFRPRTLRALTQLQKPKKAPPGKSRLDDVQVWQTGGARSRNHKKTRFSRTSSVETRVFPEAHCQHIFWTGEDYRGSIFVHDRFYRVAGIRFCTLDK
jgi:hypothetical protein